MNLDECVKARENFEKKYQWSMKYHENMVRLTRYLTNRNFDKTNENYKWWMNYAKKFIVKAEIVYRCDNGVCYVAYIDRNNNVCGAHHDIFDGKHIDFLKDIGAIN